MEGAALVCLLCLQGSLLVNTLKCAEKGTDEYGMECAGGHSTKAMPAELSALKPLAPSGELKEPGLVQLAQRVRRQTDKEKKRRKLSRPGAYSVHAMMRPVLTMKQSMVIPVVTEKPPAQRVRRQTDKEKKKRPPRPGTFTPMMRPVLTMKQSMVIPVVTEKPPVSREKRQLESGRDRPNKFYYPGSTSVTGQPMRLMLTERARRQLSNNKKKPKRKSRVGSFSLLSNPQAIPLQVTRVRRQLQNDKRKKGTGHSGRYSVLGNLIPPLQGHRSKRNLQPKKKTTTKKIVCS